MQQSPSASSPGLRSYILCFFGYIPLIKFHYSIPSTITFHFNSACTSIFSQIISLIDLVCNPYSAFFRLLRHEKDNLLDIPWLSWYS